MAQARGNEVADRAQAFAVDGGEGGVVMPGCLIKPGGVAGVTEIGWCSVGVARALPKTYVNERDFVQSACDVITGGSMSEKSVRLYDPGILRGSLGAAVDWLHGANPTFPVMGVVALAVAYADNAEEVGKWVSFTFAALEDDAIDPIVVSFKVPRVIAAHYWSVSKRPVEYAGFYGAHGTTLVTRASEGGGLPGYERVASSSSLLVSLVPKPYKLGLLDHLVACLMDVEIQRSSPRWLSGYCYLALVAPRERQRARLALGSWPLVADFLQWMHSSSLDFAENQVVYAVGPQHLHVAAAGWAPALTLPVLEDVLACRFGSEFNTWRIGGVPDKSDAVVHTGNLRRKHLGSVQALASHLAMHRRCCLRYPTEFGPPGFLGGYSYLLSIKEQFRTAAAMMMGSEPALSEYVSWVLEHPWAFNRASRMILVDDVTVAFRSAEMPKEGYRGVRRMLWRLLVEFDWPKRGYIMV